MRRRVGLVAAAAALLLTGACGVPVQDQAEPLPSGALPASASAPSERPTAEMTDVYFVSGRMLEPVAEPLQDRSANGVMAALALGPPGKRAADLRTLLVDPLTGRPMLFVASVDPSGRVVLQSTEAYGSMTGTYQTLLVGQVVQSLNQVGLSSVVVTDPQGTALALSLPDGRVKDGPVTARDFAGLVAP